MSALRVGNRREREEGRFFANPNEYASRDARAGEGERGRGRRNPWAGMTDGNGNGATLEERKKKERRRRRRRRRHYSTMYVVFFASNSEFPSPFSSLR